MKTEQTRGIVLSRTDYGEADRIVTVITPDHGKRRLMVRGVRRMKSKMAGGIELFSISELSYIKGRGEIDTMVSTRLEKYYSNIVNDIDRVQLGYELIKVINRATEDEPEPEYFELLQASFKALNNQVIDAELIRIWFMAQLLSFAGHSPNLATDNQNNKLDSSDAYNFDYDSMSFNATTRGTYKADDIKFLRLLFSHHNPQTINKVTGLPNLLKKSSPLVKNLFQAQIRS